MQICFQEWPYLEPQQVIIQVWITSHFGVLSKRPASRMRGFPSSGPCLLLPAWAVKPIRAFFCLAAIRIVEG
jgi:hypothetical protein